MRDWTREQTPEWKNKRNEYMRQWRIENKEQFKRNQKRAYDKMRLECLTHYCKGKKPFCQCCGEDEILFLHLDHINGDGVAHRKQMEKEQGYISGGNNLPYWLKKNKYPKGFQVLCANCNLAKRVDKICPHQLKVI